MTYVTVLTYVILLTSGAAVSPAPSLERGSHHQTVIGRLWHRRRVGWLARSALVVAVGIGTPCATHAQRRALALPVMPPGRILRAWLDAFNSGDSLRLDAYYRQYEPGNLAPTSIAFVRETGGFNVRHVEQTSPRHIEVALEERNSSRATYAIVTTAADGSMKVTTFRLTPLGENGTADAARIDAATRARVIDGALKPLDQRYVFIDLRENGGGDPAMVAHIESYLFSQKTQLTASPVSTTVNGDRTVRTYRNGIVVVDSADNRTFHMKK